VEGAAKVGTAEISAAVGCVAAKKDRLEAAVAEAALQGGDVERGVDGVAGECVVQLEAELVVGGESGLSAPE